jgi:hypothetical protein
VSRATASTRIAPIVTRTAELPAYRIELHGARCPCLPCAGTPVTNSLSAHAKGMLAITAAVVVTAIMFVVDPHATVAALAAPFGVGL